MCVPSRLLITAAAPPSPYETLGRVHPLMLPRGESPPKSHRRLYCRFFRDLASTRCVLLLFVQFVMVDVHFLQFKVHFGQFLQFYALSDALWVVYYSFPAFGIDEVRVSPVSCKL